VLACEGSMCHPIEERKKTVSRILPFLLSSVVDKLSIRHWYHYFYADYFISHHTRTCNRITFHYSEPNLLLTGSQDGSVALIVRRPYLLLLCLLLRDCLLLATHGAVKIK